MICECCEEAVGARRPFKLDMVGSAVKLVCMGCFSDLMEAAQTVRDASGRVAFSVVAMKPIDPVALFSDEAITMQRVDLSPADADDASA